MPWTCLRPYPQWWLYSTGLNRLKLVLKDYHKIYYQAHKSGLAQKIATSSHLIASYCTTSICVLDSPLPAHHCGPMRYNSIEISEINITPQVHMSESLFRLGSLSLDYTPEQMNGANSRHTLDKFRVQTKSNSNWSGDPRLKIKFFAMVAAICIYEALHGPSPERFVRTIDRVPRRWS